MRIIRLFVLVIISGFFATCASNDEIEITLELETELPPGGVVRLMELREEGFATIDTLHSTSNLLYQTTIPKSNSVGSFYRIDIPYNQYINLSLTSDDNQVTAKLDGRKKSVIGSTLSQRLIEIDELLESAVIRRTELNMQGRVYSKKQQFDSVEIVKKDFEESELKLNSDLKNLIRESSPSLVSLYGLNFIDMESEFSFYDSMVTSCTVRFPEHFWPKLLSSNLDKIRDLRLGHTAPDFTLNDPDGNPISLSQLRGKYVLIDFWAAWCKPCREENPNVVRAYQKYGGEKFEILGVSLDRTKEAWLKAIEDDGLPWIQVSDLQYFNSEAARLYNINAIPATYLVDPDGKIVEKNLRGASLEAKLLELFGE